MIYIAFVNIPARIVITDDGTYYPITKFIDYNGDECEPDDAWRAVAGSGEIQFAFDPLDNFDQIAVH